LRGGQLVSGEIGAVVVQRLGNIPGGGCGQTGCDGDRADTGLSPLSAANVTRCTETVTNADPTRLLGTPPGESSAPSEPHGGSLTSRLNWLRAGVLGANDGIISIAGLVIGVAAATTDTGQIATAGVAGLVAGAVSMALGEYVSVSTQRDTERALIDKERRELEQSPDDEHAELIELLRGRGLSGESSETVAFELTQRDLLGAHLSLELGIDQEDLANPWAAAGSSALAFTIGAMLPMLGILLPPASFRIPVAFVAVLLGLLVTGLLSAQLGGSPRRAAALRLVIGGALAMSVTFGIGELLGIAVA
jgi:vacuolar iron transporter family protein